jgi:FkbM family methyltransferase
MTALFASAIFPTEQETPAILDFFQSTPRGFFVDVGANDPVLHSQTYALERRGWTGVLIEPLPDKARELRAARKAKVFEIACSSRADQGRELTLQVAGPHSSLQTELAVAGVAATDRIAVRATTLDRVLREARAPTPVDFVSIDVEGHELAVLDGFDLALWRPRLLYIEDLAMDLRLHRYLNERGYRWFRRTGLNAWFAPADAVPPVSLFGRWQYVRKHYLSLPFRHVREFKRRKLGAGRGLSKP